MTSVQLTPVQAAGSGHAALQAYRTLLDALNSGTFAPDSRLPGERSLAEQLGISRATVRQVLTALADTGMLRASANRGWFVAARSLSEGPNALHSFTESARQRGLTPTSQVLARQVRPATLDEAESLGIAPAAAIVQIERLRAMDGVPIGVDDASLPLARVPGLDTMDLTDHSLYQVLSERYGITPTRCDYEAQAQAASERAATLLGIAPGAPVLVGFQTTFDQDERAIAVGSTTFRGDAYRFKASMFRA